MLRTYFDIFRSDLATARATQLVTSILFVFLSSVGCAQTYYLGSSGDKTDMNAILNQIKPGQIVIISENHGFRPHHQNQRDLLVQFSAASFPLSVGMEFFSYPDQALVDQFTSDNLTEEDFLKQIKWGKIPFDNYRFQVRLPHYRSGQTLALNAPRALTTKIKDSGLDSLTDEEKKWLPPNFALGLPTYFERFRETMKDHAKPEQIEKYFASQSVWDDTMAWQATEYMKRVPNALLVIIVGDFHVAYQDGLVARLRARGAQNILSISQVNTSDMSDDERKAAIMPSAVYGSRADYIFDVN